MTQLPLPLTTRPALGREDFIVGAGNEGAVAFIDAWPHWPQPAAAIYGPPGSGKSHLVHAWAARAGAAVLEASALDEHALSQLSPEQSVAIEDIDRAQPAAHEGALFTLMERGRGVLFTGREPPAAWPVLMPDLSSRYRALIAFALWAPDDALLAALAHKLFADRQLVVPEAVVERMIRHLERSPAAIRDFVARADERALAEKRPITTALIRELIGEA